MEHVRDEIGEEDEEEPRQDNEADGSAAAPIPQSPIRWDRRARVGDGGVEGGEDEDEEGDEGDEAGDEAGDEGDQEGM